MSKSLFDSIRWDEVHEHPGDDLADIVINSYKTSCLIKYVSNAYLNGFINYVNLIRSACLCEYAEHDDQRNERVRLIHEVAIQLDNYHTDLSTISDSFYILAESSFKYWIFLYDADCSDCIIGSIPKSEISEERLIQLYEEELKSEYPNHFLMDVKKMTGWRRI